MSEDDEDVIIGMLSLPEATKVNGQQLHTHTGETEIRRPLEKSERLAARCIAGRVLHGVARWRGRWAIAELLWAFARCHWVLVSPDLNGRAPTDPLAQPFGTNARIGNSWSGIDHTVLPPGCGRLETCSPMDGALDLQTVLSLSQVRDVLLQPR